MALSIDLKGIKPLIGGLLGGKDESKPAAPPAPMTPPPPQATPAVAGFTEWSSDPKNQQKVVQGITPPGQSIIPANAMAANTPPAMPPLSSPAVTPKITPPPGIDPALTSRVDADRAQLDNLRMGSGASQVKNKAGRIAAEVGDVAASILAPRLASAIPGTTAHNLMLQDRANDRLTQDQNAAKSAADLADKQEETRLRPITADIKQQAQDLKEQQAQNALAQNYAKIGFKQGPDGSWVPDPDSPITKERTQKDELLTAQVESAKAQKQLRDAQAALAKAKNDPNSPAFRQAQQRLAIAQQNASAAGVRAQSYMGRYLQSAFNKDLNGNDLPGAPVITDDSGNETTVGTSNATTATKNQSNAAMFNEVKNATDDIENKAQGLVSQGGKLNDPRVAAAIADPKSTSQQWAQGQFVNSGLTPAQRDYVIAVKAYHERLQPLRKSAGGGVSDAQVDRLMQMAPGAGTPDLDYLKRQTAAIRQLQGNLSAGATTSRGGLKIQGPSMTPPPQSGATTYKQTATGPAGHKIGSNDGGNTWFDVKTGKVVK